jgi:hypothetical protein
MPVNIELLFNNCPEVAGFSEGCQALLEKLMTITSPMDFNNDFASDEELDRLEQELDRLDTKNPNVESFKKIVVDLKEKKANGFIFI